VGAPFDIKKAQKNSTTEIVEFFNFSRGVLFCFDPSVNAIDKNTRTSNPVTKCLGFPISGPEGMQEHLCVSGLVLGKFTRKWCLTFSVFNERL
jgi:hypothetical protein